MQTTTEEQERALQRTAPSETAWDRESILAALDRDIAVRRKRRLAMPVVRLAVGVVLFAVVGGLLQTIGVDTAGGPRGVLMLGLLLLATVLARRLLRCGLLRPRAGDLGQLREVRAVATLLDMLSVPASTGVPYDGATQQAARDALIRLLPGVRAAEAHLFDARRLRWLYDAARRTDLDLAVAAVQAIAYVGDEAAVPLVRGLTEQWRAGGPPPAGLRKAARECLPVLEARLRREQPGRVLLRPADAPADPAAVLLRPAAGVEEPDPRVLLRPAATPAEEEHLSL